MNQFIDTIFNRPRNPTAILFLVEDSDFMNCLQRSLRDSYLLLVLEAISRNNAPDLTQVLWMSTSDRHPLETPPDPLLYHQLLQDHTHLNGRHGIATPTNILSAIKALSSTFGGTAATRHLFIFTGLGPSLPTPHDTVSWIPTICRLKEDGIQVHFITPSQYSGSLTTFYRDLINEGSVFQIFADGICFTFRLTVPSGPIGTVHPEPASKPHITPETDRFVSHQPAHSTTPINEPGLVRRLQEMTGVEKKRRSRARREQLPYSRTTHPTSPQAFVQGSSSSTDRLFDAHTSLPSSSEPSVSNSRFSFGR